MFWILAIIAAFFAGGWCSYWFVGKKAEERAEMYLQKLHIEQMVLDGIPPEEPVFLLRAQNIYAAIVLRHLARLYQYDDVNEQEVRSTLKTAEAMDRWPKRGMPGTLPN